MVREISKLKTLEDLADCLKDSYDIFVPIEDPKRFCLPISLKPIVEKLVNDALAYKQFPIWECGACGNRTQGEDPYMLYENDIDGAEPHKVCRNCEEFDQLRII